MRRFLPVVIAFTSVALVFGSGYAQDARPAPPERIHLVLNGAVAPVIETRPAGRNVFIGQSVTFTVVAGGDGRLHYQWKKDNVNVGFDNVSHLIASAQNTDAGTYTVTVTNTMGSVTSRPATLVVANAVNPRLFFDGPQVTSLRSKVKTGPCSGWYASVKLSATSGLSYAGQDEALLSRYARDMAFVYLIEGGAAMRDQTVKFLGFIGAYDQDWNSFGWIWAGELLNYAIAYDWIQSALTRAEDTNIQSKLEAACQKTFDLYRNPPWYSGTPGTVSHRYFTNVRLRIAAGLGAASLALGSYGNAQTRMDYVLDDLFTDKLAGAGYPTGMPGFQIKAMVARDGIYKEGNSYQNDSFTALTPFLLAYRHLTGLDPFAGIRGFDNRLQQMYLSNLELMMPDGSAPTTSTGWMGPSSTNMVAAGSLPDGAAQMWYWNYAYNRAPWIPALAVIFYNEALDAAAHPPQHTSRIMTTAAVFRTGWTAEDTWLLLNSEDEPCRSTHDQPSQTSIALYARGAYLLIDPGDGRSYGETAPEHAWLRQSPVAHNLVTIDGKEGPIGTSPATPAKVWKYDVMNESIVDPAFLDEGFTSPFFDYAQSRIDSYHDASDVSSRRSVFFPAKEYFVVLDELTSANSHRYDNLLHFGGEPGTGVINGALTIGTNEATWSTRNVNSEMVELRAVFLNPAPTITSQTGPTNWTSGLTMNHTYLRASAQGAQVDFLTVLLPRKTSETAAQLTRLTGIGTVGGTLTLGERIDTHGLTNRGGTAIAIGNLHADATYAFVRETSGTPTMLALKRGLQLDYAGTHWLDATERLTLALNMTGPDSYTGRIVNPGRAVSLNLRAPAGRRATQVKLDGADLAFTQANGMVTTTFSTGGNLDMTFAVEP